jgi:uncharacterized membrane protein YjfL (UPF0719 family)
MYADLGTDLVAVLLYGVVGVVLMALGYVLVDIVTPGKLRDLIWVQRNPNASLLLASNLIGVGTVVVASIVASGGDLAFGLVSTLAYGVLGLILIGASFVLLDIVTPGKLGELLCEPALHPGTWVSASAHIAVGAVTAAAII